MNKTGKNLFSVILLVLSCSIFTFAQIETPKSSEWKTLAPENEEFSIETPVPFKTVNYSKFDPSARYSNIYEGTYFYIFSDFPKKTSQFNLAMRFVKAYRQTGNIEKIGEFETEKFAFTDNEDFYHTVLTAKDKNRVYVFQTVSPTRENSAVERFFASLRLNSKPDTEINPVPENDKEPLRINPAAKTGNINGKLSISSGSGMGSGNGNGTQEGNGIKNNTETKPTTSSNSENLTAGVKILGKPRATYTDFARLYGISGKVILRVPFLADGTIGEIAVISKLPFGLTQQSIEAARGIQFEPAVSKGNPYSVTKPVEYSFTIY